MTKILLSLTMVVNYWCQMVFETLQNLIVVNYLLLYSISICQQMIFDPLLHQHLSADDLRNHHESLQNPHENYCEKHPSSEADTGSYLLLSWTVQMILLEMTLKEFTRWFFSEDISILATHLVMQSWYLAEWATIQAARVSDTVKNCLFVLTHCTTARTSTRIFQLTALPKQEHTIGWSCHCQVALGVCTTTIWQLSLYKEREINNSFTHWVWE